MNPTLVQLYNRIVQLECIAKVENMSYVTSEMVDWVLLRMVNLERELNSLYSDHGLPFRENTGRRNAILSHMQEISLSEALNNHGEIARVDGRTGHPDVCVDSRHREIECKLTSGSGGSWSLQADYATLSKKSSLDFLYVLANKEFNSFAVLFFEGLTKEDFHYPAPGSREKSRMNKREAMKKCTVLMGSVSEKNTGLIEQYREKLADTVADSFTRLKSVDDRISDTTAPKKLLSLKAGKKNLIDRFLKKIENISEKIVYWSEAPVQFTIELERYEA